MRTDSDYSDGVLIIRHMADADTLWFAYFAPYSSERHAALVPRYAPLPGIGHTVLGKTLDGRPIDLLTMGTGPLQIWLYARQHPGETMSEWWMEGALDVPTGDDPLVARLLETATLWIVPNMNPDGTADQCCRRQSRP